MNSIQQSAAAFALLALTAGGAWAAKADVTIGIQLEPPHLDPTSAAAGAIDQVLYSNIFEGLTRFGPDGSVGPGLAESWEISDDGTTYTFNLRPGVKFHDGTDLEATDVVFSLDRARAEDSQNAQKALFAGIKSVEATGPTTVVVTLNAPQGNFLFNMAWGDAVIVAPESIDGIKGNPVGTGAFRFSEWKRGDSITIVRNADYWGAAPALEQATFKFISEPTAAFSAMMAGDIDAFYSYPAPENLVQFEADPRFTVLAGNTEGEGPSLRSTTRWSHLAMSRVRKAVSMAIGPSGDHWTEPCSDTARQSEPTSHRITPDYVDLTGNAPHGPGGRQGPLGRSGISRRLRGPRSSCRRHPTRGAGGEIIARANCARSESRPRYPTLNGRSGWNRCFAVTDYGLTIVQPHRAHGTSESTHARNTISSMGQSGVPGIDQRLERRERPGSAIGNAAGGATDHLGRLCQRLSLPAGAHFGCGCKAERNLARRSDAGRGTLPEVSWTE